jgi:enoyl-CoA hydratase
MSKAISVERTGPIARVTVRDSERLDEALEALAEDEGVLAVVLSGESHAAEAVAAFPKPAIAVCTGEVTGGALALAIASDIRVATEHTTFAVPEVAGGQLPVPGTIARLVRLVGAGNASRLVLIGDSIDAAEALRIGLVSEIAANAEARAMEIAKRIAERGPIAVRYAKEAATRGLEMPLEQALRFETDLTIILQTTEDRAEGVRAFLDKREPKFKGK